MNLLVFLDRRFPSDHAFIEEVYTRFLPRHGHRVLLVMPASAEAASQRVEECWIEPFNEAEALVFKAPGLRSLGGVMRYLRSAIRLRKRIGQLLDERKIDVIGVRNDVVLGMLALTLGRSRAVPMVFQLSHPKEESLMDYARRGIYRDRVFSWTKGFLGKVIRDHAILRNAKAVMAVSDQMRAYLGEHGVAEEKLCVVPLGANPIPSAFREGYKRCRPESRAQMGIDPRDRVLIYVGTLSRMRGLDFLIDVTAEVRRRGSRAILLVVGKPEREGDAARLEAYAAEKSMTENCRFVYEVPRQEVVRYLAMADVALSPFPPEWILRMNSPMKLMEYMAAGLPVVASDTPEQSAILKASGGGSCVQHDVSSFASAIEGLCGDLPHAAEVGEKGRRFIEAERSYEKLGGRVEEIYQSVCRCARPTC